MAPKVYCGEEHISVPPQEVRDEQVNNWQALKAEWTETREAKKKFKGRQWCQSGEAIMAQLKAEDSP